MLKGRKMKELTVILMSIFLVLIFVNHSYAYIDPGTGSIILQATLAAIVGSAVTIKLFWQRIKIFFLRLVGKDKPNNADKKK